LAWLAVLSGLLVVGCSEDPAKKGDNQSIDNKGDGDSEDEGDGDSEDEGDGDSEDEGDGDGDYTPGDGDSTTGDGDDDEFPEGDGDDDGVIVDNDGGVHTPVDDAGTGSIPPPTDGGKWTLKSGSAPDCPPEPPPIPLLGGVCIGFYWQCGWENEAKQQYSCVCDLVHYLCVPL
jgi:hypothetical protein